MLPLGLLCGVAGCVVPHTPAPIASRPGALESWRIHEGFGELRSGTIDLNGNGVDEYVVRATDQDYCGSGGCTFFVLSAKAGGLRTVSRSTVTREPIRALSTTTHGWRDLIVRVGGGGIETHDVILRWTGKGYPANPSLAPPYSGPSAGEMVVLRNGPAVTRPPAPPRAAPPSDGP